MSNSPSLSWALAWLWGPPYIHIELTIPLPFTLGYRQQTFYFLLRTVSSPFVDLSAMPTCCSPSESERPSLSFQLNLSGLPLLHLFLSSLMPTSSTMASAKNHQPSVLPLAASRTDGGHHPCTSIAPRLRDEAEIVSTSFPKKACPMAPPPTFAAVRNSRSHRSHHLYDDYIYFDGAQYSFIWLENWCAFVPLVRLPEASPDT